MADNIQVRDVSGATRILSTDEQTGGVHVQRFKPQHGPDGSAVDVSSTNPMPVQLSLITPTLKGGTNGTIALPAPRLLWLSCVAGASGATVTIGSSSFTVPAGMSWERDYSRYDLRPSSLVLTGTTTYELGASA